MLTECFAIEEKKVDELINWIMCAIMTGSVMLWKQRDKLNELLTRQKKAKIRLNKKNKPKPLPPE